ncbi:MAG: GNAT family N-acetyltransferase [Pseudobdellovibrionaceae bacterium]
MKVKDLKPAILEQLVELECRNILPILSSVGLLFTENDMRDQLRHFEGSDVVVCEKNGTVDGFIIYDTKEAEAMIITFNLRRRNSKRVLQSLLSQVLQKLGGSDVNIINSRAHHTNIISINFHKKMGFREIQRNDKFIEFQTLVPQLLQIINQRVGI